MNGTRGSSTTVHIHQIASAETLDAAFAWLCERRVDYAASADVWNLRRRWAESRPRLQHDLLRGLYRFSPLKRIHIQGDGLELWSALDALVLKAVAITMIRTLAFPGACYHIPAKENELPRGAKAAVRFVCSHLPKNQFIFRSDVKSYYASIDHAVLLALLRDRVDDPIVMDLIGQYLHRTVEAGGNYHTVTRGISLMPHSF